MQIEWRWVVAENGDFESEGIDCSDIVGVAQLGYSYGAVVGPAGNLTDAPYADACRDRGDPE
jgi:hypothetical protein